MVRDVGLAEELAQDALVVALEQWPEAGIPENPGAWLMQTAKNRAIDQLRRRRVVDRKHEELALLDPAQAPDVERAIDEDVGDDLLRLVFIACHPVLSTDARVALTLRLLGGLETPEIARAFLVSEPTIATAHRAREEDARGRERAVRDAPARGARRAPLLGARGDLSDLQRGALGDERRRLGSPVALRGRAPPRSHLGRARPERARGPRPRRADGDSSVAPPRARRAFG